MRIIVTGSLAYDYIMNFPGKFSDHILPDKVHMLTVSFLVDSMKKMRGGVAGNIAYTMALLGERPLVISAAGQDFGEYRKFMEFAGIDASGIKEVANEFTASCFINTDMVNNQIVAFYPGAVGHAKEVSLQSMGLKKDDWVIISPTDPESMAKHTNECKALGAKYIFDPGKQVPRLDKKQILDGLDGASVLVGNDYEFGMMAKATDLTEAALIAKVPVTIMTRGGEGSQIYEKGVKTHEIPIAKVSAVVDPTGAGDAFIGAMALGLARGWSLGVAGRVASLAAAWTIETKGCQEHKYTRGEFARRYVENFGQAKELESFSG